MASALSHAMASVAASVPGQRLSARFFYFVISTLDASNLLPCFT